MEGRTNASIAQALEGGCHRSRPMHVWIGNKRAQW